MCTRSKAPYYVLTAVQDSGTQVCRTQLPARWPQQYYLKVRLAAICKPCFSETELFCARANAANFFCRHSFLFPLKRSALPAGNIAVSSPPAPQLALSHLAVSLTYSHIVFPPSAFSNFLFCLQVVICPQKFLFARQRLLSTCPSWSPNSTCLHFGFQFL